MASATLLDRLELFMKTVIKRSVISRFRNLHEALKAVSKLLSIELYVSYFVVHMIK